MIQTVTQPDASPVYPAQPRQTVQVHFTDGRTFEAPLNSTIEAFVHAAYPDLAVPVMAALVDGELRELTYPLTHDSRVTLLPLSSSDGERIYRRSLAFLLIVAVHELFPEAHVFVEYSMPYGGFFCQLQGRPQFSRAELVQVEKRMQAMVEQDLPIVREVVPLEEALRIFRERGEEDKVGLLHWRTKDYLSMYRLKDTSDYFHGYMVPSTGYLRTFALRHQLTGFIVQYPRRRSPNQLQPAQDSPSLTAVFEEYNNWLHVLGVGDVSSLNQALCDQRIREVVLVAEALHEQRIAQIAGQIAARLPQVRMVLIAGPSSSGKTTFSRRLAIQLLTHGIRPFTLEMDNYFVDRERTPHDENGDYDFEALGALDVGLFNRDVADLIEGQEIQLPHYNFLTGRRELGDLVCLDQDQIVIAEGIHGLNPQLIQLIPHERIFRIYVSALTQLNIDRHNRVPTTDTRLVRRIVRDAASRGYTAEETLARWESVRRGEKRNIFPYQENADVLFNSALVYELAVLKPLVEPLLWQVEPSSLRRVEAKRLLALLQWFEPIPPDLVPDNSILREFVGSSILRDYVPGTLASKG